MGERHRYATLTAMVAFAVAISACGPATVETTTTEAPSADTNPTPPPIDTSRPTPVIVDYSPTVSDVGGLMYLLAHPDVEVIAISLPITGEAGCELGAEVTLGILAMFGQEDIPVACDLDFPAAANEWPPEFLVGSEDLTFGLPESAAVLSDESAPDLIARVAAESDRPVVIYAVAPLTNVARALADHPDLAGNIERIVMMGGAVDVAGNVEGTNAEWNVWIDIAAAADVIASGVPMTMVPLDATEFVPVPGWYPSALESAQQTDAIVYLGRMVKIFPSVTSGFYYFWDELAASVAAGETLTTNEERNIVVVEDGADEGRTAPDGDGLPITVATGVDDPIAFYANFLSTLAGAPVEVGSPATPEEEAYLRAVGASFDDMFAALDAFFTDPSLGPDAPYNAVAVSEAIDLVLTGLASSVVIVAALEPPPSLATLHDDYLADMGALLETKDETVSGLADAATWDEADAVIARFDIDSACLPMAEAANLLGVAIRLPCN